MTDVSWLELFSDAPMDVALRARPDLPRASRLADDGTNALEAYVAFGYEEVSRVLSDELTYSCTAVSDRYQPVLGQAGVLGLEGAAHRALRSAVTAGLGSIALPDIERRVVRPYVEELLNQFKRSRELDLVPELSQVLPVRVIAEVLGLAGEKLPNLAELSRDLFLYVSAPKRAVRAARALRRLCKDSIAIVKSGHQTNGLIASLLESQGEIGMSDDALLDLLVLLVGAATKTTSDAIANALYLILRHDLLLSVAGNESLLSGTIEESLRFESPAQVLARVTRVPTQLGDLELPTGSLVLVHVGAANWDPFAFIRPHQFQPRRSDETRHLAFGWGAHRCLGMTLARVEIRVAVEGIAERFPSIKIDFERAQSISGTLFRSVPTIPVSI